ncbi:MAG TPA: FKBP-type peptidyl-prolyl cis-trans isomerase [Bacteroidia bacterium]|nr:FKBP-type peptidyl-prolyl cis-trans isomerase [Bacteroidia bacterium]
MLKKGSWIILLVIGLLIQLPLFSQSDTVFTADSILIVYEEHGEGPKAIDRRYITSHHTIKTSEGRKLRDTYKTGQPLIISLEDTVDKMGWVNLLKMLRVGDEVKIVIPPRVTYKNWKAFMPTKPFREFPLIIKMLVLSAEDEVPPEAEVVFDEAFNKKIPEAFDVTGKDTVKLKSGLQYIVVHDNPVGEQAYANRKVKVHYTGYFTDGTIFGCSYLSDEPYEFTLMTGTVILGWDEGIRLMKTGDKYRLIVPPHLAYGKSGEGDIPPNSTIIFDVELISVN